ncbi:Actin [Ostertagia ostertagi]
MDVAGRDVTRWLRLLLRKEGTDLHRTSEFEIVREIKEKACYLATNVVKEEANESDKLIYPLPDGSRLEIGASRFRAPEVLFRPELIGEEWPGIPQLVNDSIKKCDMDVRKTLYGSIILSGGSTLLQGFGDRLLSEMRKISPQDLKVRITAPQERLYSTWIGGSILASLDTFRKLWVSKKEYEDEGKKILHRKFF